MHLHSKIKFLGQGFQTGQTDTRHRHDQMHYYAALAGGKDGISAHWPWASYLHLCASVTKQYNLVPAKGAISLAGKVTEGLVESNDSLPPGL